MKDLTPQTHKPMNAGILDSSKKDKSPSPSTTEKTFEPEKKNKAQGDLLVAPKKPKPEPVKDEPKFDPELEAKEAVREAPEKVEAIEETVDEFLTKVAQAKREKEAGIETAQNIIDKFNRNGVGPSGYFIYEGIKCYPIGRREEIEAKESMQIGQILHGPKEALIDNR